ncbi:MAG: phosphoribosylformylglycinamidine synthase subunit PurS [Elusimicrobia bacterium]|nr:phosphoribosylformylglycinamidine synthase subunit PurS [Elusimicrobiota bacterium]
MSAKAPQSHVYLAEVRLKSDYSDSEGQAALSLLHSLGVNTAHEVRTSQIYKIKGPFSLSHIQQAARELLADSVTQEFRMLAPSAPGSNGASLWRVEVWLKDSVTDPVGETVRQTLAEMGLAEPESVRVGTAYYITGKCGRHQLEKAVPRCLANPVVHRFSVSEAA